MERIDEFVAKANQIVVNNYNQHKNEKNKTLLLEHVETITFDETASYLKAFVVTKRKDGLLYEVYEDKLTGIIKVDVFNRIARTTLQTLNTQKEQNA